jgi:superfamily II DNA/RNA helicase
MPSNIEDYIHRIGRTGRINNAGLATSFIYNNNKKIIPDLINILQQNGNLHCCSSLSLLIPLSITDQPIPAWLKQILNAPVENKQ